MMHTVSPDQFEFLPLAAAFRTIRQDVETYRDLRNQLAALIAQNPTWRPELLADWLCASRATTSAFLNYYTEQEAAWLRDCMIAPRSTPSRTRKPRPPEV